MNFTYKGPIFQTDMRHFGEIQARMKPAPAVVCLRTCAGSKRFNQRDSDSRLFIKHVASKLSGRREHRFRCRRWRVLAFSRAFAVPASISGTRCQHDKPRVGAAVSRRFFRGLAQVCAVRAAASCRCIYATLYYACTHAATQVI